MEPPELVELSEDVLLIVTMRAPPFDGEALFPWRLAGRADIPEVLLLFRSGLLLVEDRSELLSDFKFDDAAEAMLDAALMMVDVAELLFAGLLLLEDALSFLVLSILLLKIPISRSGIGLKVLASGEEGVVGRQLTLVS